VYIECANIYILCLDLYVVHTKDEWTQPPAHLQHKEKCPPTVQELSAHRTKKQLSQIVDLQLGREEGHQRQCGWAQKARVCGGEALGRSTDSEDDFMKLYIIIVHFKFLTCNILFKD